MKRAIEVLRTGDWKEAALLIGGITMLAVNTVLVVAVMS